MLYLDHPMTQHIFAAARAEDAILMAAKRMTIAARLERIRIRDSCSAAFSELRRLNRDHFADRPAIPPAIEALEQSLSELAALVVVAEDGPPAELICPACQTTLERRGKYGSPAPDRPTDIYCSPCMETVMPPLQVLRSESGFGTDAI
ncbi:Hypothetical protein A7982_02162 [Minicystis rosea]|nr:Hypothetical protein A7982_02162 [Minicystis rosea]